MLSEFDRLQGKVRWFLTSFEDTISVQTQLKFSTEFKLALIKSEMNCNQLQIFQYWLAEQLCAIKTSAV